MRWGEQIRFYKCLVMYIGDFMKQVFGKKKNPNWRQGKDLFKSLEYIK